jgi:mannosyltransferase
MAIILILVLALVLRLINLNQSLWLDEAVQAITAKESFLYIFGEILGDFHPPLFHFLMHFWVRLFGTSEISLRMPSVLFGVGTVYLVYLLARQIAGSKIKGLLSAAFMASAPFHIYYSQEARMYSMTCFFAALSMFFFVKINGLFINGLANSQKKFRILWFVSTALLIYSDYFGFLVLAAQFLILLQQKRYKFMVHGSLFIVLIYLPWLPMFIKQLQVGSSATTALPEWGRLVNLSFLKALPLTFVKFSIGRITIFNKMLYGGIAVLLAGVYGFLGLRAAKEKILTGWFLVPLVFAWAASLWVPNFQPFRLLLILPAFYLLLALGVGSIKSKKVRMVVTAFVLAVNFLSLFRYYSNPYFQREDWKGLVEFLKTQESSLVILPSNTSAWPIKYYDSSNRVKLVYGSEGINKVSSDQLPVIGDQKVWYVRYLVPLFDPEEKILQELQSSNYSKIKEISFNQISVWEYALLKDNSVKK